MEQPLIDTKTLFAPKKGKQATKGQKQIHEGNMDTIRYYSKIVIVAIFIKLVHWVTMDMTISIGNVFILFAWALEIGAIYGMYFMAKPVISGTSKAVVDGGIDLNLEGGFANYLKDLIITTAFCTAASGLLGFVWSSSNLFWLLWLWLPAYYVYKVWTSVIAPWIFAPAPEVEPEVADKKRKKMERKMARAGYR